LQNSSQINYDNFSKIKMKHLMSGERRVATNERQQTIFEKKNVKANTLFNHFTEFNLYFHSPICC